jgi:SAM-dependent methyltransferase
VKKKVNKKNVIDIIESYYLAHFIRYLQKENIFNAAGYVNQQYAKDKTILYILSFLHLRTDIVTWHSQKGYCLARKYASYPQLGFYMDKFIGAYGNFDFNKADKILQIDQQEFADAYEKVQPFCNYAFMLYLIGELKAEHILDLGCGMAGLITGFCKSAAGRRATGIDSNPYNCKKVKSRLVKEGLQKSVKIICGNAADFKKLLPGITCKSVDVVYAANLINEFFGKGNDAAVEFLQQLKDTFSGKKMVITDYYRTYGTGEAANPALQHNYLHDIMQIFSGQGLTPKDYKGWNTLYKKSGCRLLNVFEGESTGIKWFIHVLQL